MPRALRRALLLALSLPGSALAQQAQPSDCIRVPNDLDRLACYDKAAGRTPKRETVATDSAWHVAVQTSKMTDTKDVELSVTSSDKVTCRLRKPEAVSLVVRCKEGATALYLVVGGCHMASSEYNNWGHVTYRLDADKAATARMDASTDHQALGLWTGASSIPVIKKMLGKSTLLTRMMPHSESPVTATFNITGLDKAIIPLRQACKW